MYTSLHKKYKRLTQSNCFLILKFILNYISFIVLQYLNSIVQLLGPKTYCCYKETVTHKCLTINTYRNTTEHILMIAPEYVDIVPTLVVSSYFINSVVN